MISCPPDHMELLKKLLVTTMIHGTDNNEMFSWVTMNFKVDLDCYTGSWATKHEVVRLDPENYSEGYITA